MHLPAAALPGAPTLMLDPAAQAVAAQVFGRRLSWWNPGQAYLVAQLGYTPANKGGDTFTGDVILGTPGLGLRIKEGANARMGSVALAAGAATVSTTAVTANSRIMLQRQADAGTVAASYSITRVAGTSFSIQARDGTGAAQNTDTSTIAWVIFEPAP